LFLLTRFNVKLEFTCESAAQSHAKRLDPQWLAHRFELFTLYCWPSVMRQSCRDFQWLVFFDERTPESFRRRIARFAEDPRFLPVFVPWFDLRRVVAEIRHRVPANVERVITSRIDNDDAIGRDFIRTTRAALAEKNEGFVNFWDGFQWAQGKLYPSCSTSNPFLSRLEPLDSLETVLAVPHAEVVQRYPTWQIRGQHDWMQVIHECNVYNHLDAPQRRWPVLLAASRFPAVRFLLAERGLLGMLEEAWFSLGWAWRQSARRLRRRRLPDRSVSETMTNEAIGNEAIGNEAIGEPSS